MSNQKHAVNPNPKDIPNICGECRRFHLYLEPTPGDWRGFCAHNGIGRDPRSNACGNLKWMGGELIVERAQR